MLMFCLGIQNLVFAQNIQQDKIDVQKVLKRYSEVTSCETSFDDNEFSLKDIFLVNKDEDDTAYYVYWRADFGCRGGSGTTGFYISEVGHYSDPTFLVRNNAAFGEEVEQIISSGFITKVSQVNKNHFVIFTAKHDEDDSPNFPSLLYEYVVKRESNYDTWDVVSSRLIKKQ
ncbi:hypothetical protein CDG68_05450 [Acinetobacter wuhouensis]|uniref:Uncharacterized protein n=2 Tax=Acinetobacter wuhouensis TaxID=1879050 RepID=A0A3G2SZ16_9GAMM|nr:hypothetical protein CDG68_05450 [Acinetobacter wuhouensis]